MRSLSNILLDIKDIQDLKKMYRLAEDVEREVAEKLVQKALAIWDEEKMTFPLFGKTKDSYVFEERFVLEGQRRHMIMPLTKRKECIDWSKSFTLKEDIVLQIRSLYYLYPILHIPNLKVKR